MRLAKSLCRLLLVFLFSCVAHGEIVRVVRNQVWLKLGGKRVYVGERLDVLDSQGHRRAIIRVDSYDDETAYAEIESGTAAVGMRLARRNKVSVEGAESEAHMRPTPYDYDLRLNPLGLIGGAIDANFDIRVGHDWTVGPQGAYLRLQLPPSGVFNSNFKISAWGIGVRANYFFNGALINGFYLGPALEYLKVNLTTSDAYGAASGAADGVMASCLIGYGWFYHGFNLMLAGGYGTVLGASGITIKDSVGNRQTIIANLSGLTYELSAGWAF